MCKDTLGGDRHVYGLDDDDGFSVHTYPQTQVVYVKYVQLFTDQFYLNNFLRVMGEHNEHNVLT